MITRHPNGLYYVTHDGRQSGKASRTRAQAEQHLDRLQRGLVRMEPIHTKPHTPEFAPDFANHGRAIARMRV